MSRVQVLPDYRGGIRESADGQQNLSDCALWQIRNQEWVNAASSARLKVMDMQPPPKQSNLDFLRAGDNALRSIGHCYMDFKCDHPSTILTPGQTRYWVNGDVLPSDMCSNLGLVGRYCVTSSDGSRRLEVTHTPKKPLLIQWLDGGSIGWPSKFWRFSNAGGVRGAHFQDPCHRRWDHCKGSIFSQGLKGAMTDGKVNRSEITRHSTNYIYGMCV